MLTAEWPRGLLVSVRDADEAAAAVAGGAAIVDVKEPRQGALGRASAEVVVAVAEVVRHRAPLTLACGELSAVDAVLRHLADVLHRLPADGPRPTAVKAGPAGLTLPAWRTAFRRLRDGLPSGIGAVAVAYADWRRAEAPPPEAVLGEAVALGAAAILVDTHDKQGPGLFETASPQVVDRWRQTADAAGLTLVVAGRLAADEVAQAFALGVRVVGVRSAACEGGRDGRIMAPRVRSLGRLSAFEVARERPVLRGVPVS